MKTLAVTFYDVVVWLHISSVVLAFGPTFAFGIYFALAHASTRAAMPAVLEAQIDDQPLDGDDRRGPDPDHRPLPAADSLGVQRLLRRLGPPRDHRPARPRHGFFIPNDTRALRAAKRDIDAAGPTGEVELSREFNESSRRSARMGPSPA